MQRSTHFVVTQDNLVCNFPCLLKFPPADLRWVASFSYFSPVWEPVSDFTQGALEVSNQQKGFICCGKKYCDAIY